MRIVSLPAFALFAALALGGCTHDEAAVAQEPLAPELVSAGRILAEERCATCHATGLVGDSPNPAAPHFRNLSHHYQFQVLEVELREGIHVGDFQMPQFYFTVDETDALLAYLRSIQPEQRGAD